MMNEELACNIICQTQTVKYQVGLPQISMIKHLLKVNRILSGHI